MTARVTFVGSGDAFGGGGRFQACLHLDGGEEPLLLDCGATSLVALKRLGIDPHALGWIALSHLHGDHFAGVPWLTLAGQFARRTKPLTVLGPNGAERRIRGTFELLYPGAPDAERPFATRFLEFEPHVPQEFGPARITAFPVAHPSATEPHGLRVQYAGKVIAYSGDTEWTETLPALARGADLFVCECNFFDKRAPGHLDYRTLSEHRSELECERIVLTHMSEDMLNHLPEVEFETASDGGVIDV
ncbi:MAG TPA: MBL fold metallo-hydrolase [Solirubrobacteraceae bacterium]|nr:MBL fold metallo-hydrolase [Solirubrobacteraceae bacterium]